jgi:hypothetical protein
MDNDQLTTLAKKPDYGDNVEDTIPHVDDAIKQSDVLDHLKKVDANQEKLNERPRLTI